MTHLSYYKGCRNRQFGSSHLECFTSQFLWNAIHFIQHFTWFNFGNVIFHVTFTATHTNLNRLFSNRFIREYTNPNTTTTFDMTGHCTTSSFDLTGSQTTTTYGFQAELTETYLITASSDASIATLLLLTVFQSSWLQHYVYLPFFVYSHVQVWKI
ncbi:Uncharacterised protein [Neisseria meningitidis]|nr:Uncharacterised protein [Neisseria meningitidis]CKK74946.1 Uncharacterised protein [Neisseria meningitidis]